MTGRAWLGGAAVVALAVTPNILDARRAWQDDGLRLPLAAWYVAVLALALGAWRSIK